MTTTVRAFTAFLVCSLIWGTTWFAIHEGYSGLAPLWAASLRFLLAGAALLVLVAVRRPTLGLSRTQWGVVAFVGTALFAIDYGLIYWGEQFIATGTTAVLFATMPLFTGLYGAVLIPAERMTARHALEVAAGLAGLVLLFGAAVVQDASRSGPMLAIVLSAAAAGMASVVMRRWGREIPVLVLNAGAMLLGAALLALGSVAMGERRGLPTTTGAWWSLLYLAVFGSVVAFLLYWWLLRHWTANRTSLVTLVTPVVAVGTGWIALRETLSWAEAVGTLLVIAGVAVALRTPAAKPEPQATTVPEPPRS